MKNRNVVKQDYRIINGRYKLNTTEIKFVLTVIAQIDADDDDFVEYEIKVSELEERLQTEQNETRLKQFAKRLLSKPLEIPTDDGWAVFNWFSKIQYVRGQAKFLVRIDKDLKPYLLELKKRFVKYNLKYILPLTSNYSIRIYQLLKEYEKLTKRTFTVVELQDLLQVPKSLKRYDNFKRIVLQVAERELIKNCDIFFEYEEIKQQRKVTEILFRIKKNKWVLQSEQPILSKKYLNKYENYRYKKILTKEGREKEINFIEEQNEQLKINFTDGTYALLPNEDILKKVVKFN